MEITAAIVLFFVVTIFVVALRRKKVDSNTLQDWANIVTVSSVISAGIVAVIFGIRYLMNPVQSALPQTTTTPTVNQPTEASVVTAQTDSILLPTSTWTPIPSLTPPAATTIFEDAFIDNRNNWYIASAFPHIAAGKYTYKVICPTEYASFYCGTYIKIPFTFPKNFRIEMDTMVLESSPEAKIAFGFQLRRNNVDHYYIIYFMTDSFYTLKSAYNQDDLEIIPKTTTDLIERELGSTNRFGIEVQDSTFTPIINGYRLSQGEDGNLRNPGASYLIIYISRGHSAILQFDNIVVQEVR